MTDTPLLPLTLASAPDWATIEVKYHAGHPLRAIAAEHGVSHETVRKRAKAEGWSRSVDTQVDKLVDTHAVNSPAVNSVNQPGPKSSTETAAAVEKILAAAAPKPDPDDTFWQEALEGQIVIQGGRALVAVYVNPYEQIVIRERATDSDHDEVVVIDPRNVDALIGRLTELRVELAREAK